MIIIGSDAKIISAIVNPMSVVAAKVQKNTLIVSIGTFMFDFAIKL
jgi:hypothetical protein